MTAFLLVKLKPYSYAYKQNLLIQNVNIQHENIYLSWESIMSDACLINLNAFSVIKNECNFSPQLTCHITDGVILVLIFVWQQ